MYRNYLLQQKDRGGIIEAPLIEQTLNPDRHVNSLPTSAEEGAEETWMVTMDRG